MGFIDAFWKVAAELDPVARDLNESQRFPFCTRDGLTELCAEAGLNSPLVAPIEVVTEFEDFEAFWHPFTLGTGPAPGYCMSLDEHRRAALKSRLETAVGTNLPIALPARAWAAKLSITK